MACFNSPRPCRRSTLSTLASTSSVVGFGGYANSTVTCMKLAIMQCPSESRSTPMYQFPNGSTYYGYGNYAGNFGGPGPIALMSGTIIPANNWMIGTANNLTNGSAGLNMYPGATWAPVSIASVTDGTSNTGLVSERLIGIPSPYPGSLNALGFNNFGAARSTVPPARAIRGNPVCVAGHVSILCKRIGGHGHSFLR